MVSAASLVAKRRQDITRMRADLRSREVSEKHDDRFGLALRHPLNFRGDLITPQGRRLCVNAH